MCLTFAYYYPRMKMGYCMSQPQLETFPEADYQVLNYSIYPGIILIIIMLISDIFGWSLEKIQGISDLLICNPK